MLKANGHIMLSPDVLNTQSDVSLTVSQVSST